MPNHGIAVKMFQHHAVTYLLLFTLIYGITNFYPTKKKNAVPVQNAQCSHSASWRSGLHGACCKLSQGAYCKYSCVVPTTQQIIPFYEVAKLPLPIYKAADSYATKISCSCELIKPLSESPLIDIFKVLSSSQVQHSIFVSKRPL